MTKFSLKNFTLHFPNLNSKPKDKLNMYVSCFRSALWSKYISFAIEKFKLFTLLPIIMISQILLSLFMKSNFTLY